MPHALVIGIDRYAAKGIPPLKCAANDAEAMSRVLASAGFEVVTLVNDGATRENIYRELEIGLNQRVADDEDPVLIYWAGHGMTDLRDNADMDERWSTFLLPFDADLDRPLASAFAVQQVWALLNRVESRRLLVMLDTCFSGAFAGDGRGFSIGSTRGGGVSNFDFLEMEGHGSLVLTACGPRQVARESVKQGHGHFTRSVLSVMERGLERGDRAAAVGSLIAQIREEVQRETNNAQTPWLHQSSQGSDWSLPLPPPARYRPPMPSWAFVGTSGGVGKTTLAMMTAELLAEAGNNVLYVDVDIAHFGGTSEWCQRAKSDVGRVRTFADHVGSLSRAQTRTNVGNLSDNLLDVTPEYLRRYDCGKILLLPAARVSDRHFAFDLVAEIKDRRSNAVCRQILDAAFDRGLRQGATCIVIDCGAMFDPLAVNALAAVDHPFIVAAARAGARDQRETILSNCAQTVEDFDRMRIDTVVNRVPSQNALVEHWGEPGYNRPGLTFHWLPFDRNLFRDWEEGRPNFELGYDELSQAWHQVLVDSDKTSCEGLHRELLPDEWDRFKRWALWLVNNPSWAATTRTALRRGLRRAIVTGTIFALLLAAGIAGLIAWPSGDADEGRPPLVTGLSVTAVAIAGLVLLAVLLTGIGLRRRRRVVDEVIKHSVSAEQLRRWFTVPANDGRWWMVWKPSKRAAIQWVHKKVARARATELDAGRPAVY